MILERKMAEQSHVLERMASYRVGGGMGKIQEHSTARTWHDWSSAGRPAAAQSCHYCSPCWEEKRAGPWHCPQTASTTVMPHASQVASIESGGECCGL